MPPFWKFLITYIEQWTKTFCKKTGRPTGQPVMILKFTGRVEKILTGSISAADTFFKRISGADSKSLETLPT